MTQKSITELLEIQTAATSSIESADPQRITARITFDRSIALIIRTIEQCSEVTTRIKQVRKELDDKFDPSDITKTATDQSRVQLANLERQLLEQRNQIERSMIEHFDDSARPRQSDAKISVSKMSIPEHLLEKGRGLEFITNMLCFMRGRASQFYAIIPYIMRIGQDFDTVNGTYYRPPTLANALSDVDVTIREHYSQQSKALYLELQSEDPESVVTRVLSSYSYGVNNQYQDKCLENDGVFAYFSLVTLSRPSQSAYREELEAKLMAAAEAFRSGDPTKKVENFRAPVKEAIKLGIRIRWSTGKRIITTLSSRHNTFAVELSKLKDSAPNPEDAAEHLDKLFTAIDACCKDITQSQGANWSSTHSCKQSEH
mgnify:FL=1